MVEALLLNTPAFRPLSVEETLSVDGGVNWGSVAAGLGLASAVFIAIACAPASAFVGAAYVAMSVGCYSGAAGAGIAIGSGLTS